MAGLQSLLLEGAAILFLEEGSTQWLAPLSDYGGLAYTTTSEPEFHMNEILHLARAIKVLPSPYPNRICDSLISRVIPSPLPSIDSWFSQEPIHSPLGRVAHISIGTTSGGPSFNLDDGRTGQQWQKDSPVHRVPSLSLAHRVPGNLTSTGVDSSVS